MKRLSGLSFYIRVSKTIRTPENYEEYKKLPKDEQDDIKDVGGFVGGYLKEGRRKGEAVLNRSVITLDADYGQDGLWDMIEMLFDFECCMYTTHKHGKDKPRFRLVIPLSRNVTPEEMKQYQEKLRRI